jgi:hypothetical protein
MTNQVIAARVCQVSAVTAVGSFIFLVIEKVWFPSSERR